MQKCYAIVARYSDGSGAPEVLRVMVSKVKAEADLAMLKRIGAFQTVEIVESELDAQLLAGEA